MSLVPLLFSNWWEDLEHPHHLPAQHFAVGVSPERLQAPMMSSAAMQTAPSHFYNHPLQAFMNYYRPIKSGGLTNQEPGSSVVKSDKDKFEAALDIQQFAPNEVKVKVINNYVVVEGKHEEKRDEHGFVMRQFIRKYLIPEQCDVDKVTSSLSSDGVLTINAPRKQQFESLENERMIDIQHTGKPAIVAPGSTIAVGKDKFQDPKKGEEKIEDKESSDEPMKNGAEEK